MSSRPILAPFQVLTNANMSVSSTVSSVTVIQNVSMLSYAVSWSSSSSPTGTISVEVSNDYSQNAAGSVNNSGTWTTLSSLNTAVSGNSGTAFLDITQTGAYAIRLRYTKTTGDGTMQATVSGKSA